MKNLIGHPGGVRARRAALAGAVAAALLAVAACGSSDGDGGSGKDDASSQAGPGVAEAQKLVDGYTTRPTSIGITAPLGGPIPEGKTLMFLNIGTPASESVIPSLKAATEAVGWKFVSQNIGLTPAGISAGFDAALRIKPDYLIDPSLPAAAFAPQCEQFAKAGIAVIANSILKSDGEGFGDCVKAIVNGEEQQAKVGAMMAAYAVADSKGAAKVLQIGGNEFGILKPLMGSFESELKRLCSSCTSETLEVSAADIGQSIPTKVVGYLRSHPDINYVAASFDDIATGVPAALKTAGLTKVKIIGEAPQASNLIAITGGGPQTASVAFGNVESNWRTVDIALRLATGSDLSESVSSPNPAWLLTADDASDWPGDPEKFPWPNVGDYEAQYKKLWGLS